MKAVELAQSLMAPGAVPILGSTHREGETAGKVAQLLVSHDVTCVLK